MSYLKPIKTTFVRLLQSEFGECDIQYQCLIGADEPGAPGIMRIIICRRILQGARQTGQHTAAGSYLCLAQWARIFWRTRAPISVAINQDACATVLTWKASARICGNGAQWPRGARRTIARKRRSQLIWCTYSAVLAWIRCTRNGHALKASAVAEAATSIAWWAHTDRPESALDALGQRMTESSTAQIRGNCTVRPCGHRYGTRPAVADVACGTAAAVV